ncbi:MAG: cation:proton antiporter [Parahaliea sp.]
MYDNLAVFAGFAFLYSLIAGRVERSFLTGPILYIAFGLLAGPTGLGILNIEVDAVELRVLADLTLALVLFNDAAKADLKTLHSHSYIPARMLLIGLPLCMVLGAALGMLVFPDMGFYEVCVLSTMLAATDAALGKAVVSNPEVPAHVREGLNVESGLNDGLSVPVLLVFLALASGSASTDESGDLAMRLVLEELLIGVAVALVLVSIAAWLMRFAAARGWFTDIWLQIPVVTLALTCFATAQSLEGSGFIACFVGGLLFGYLAQEHTHMLVRAAEELGELAAMLTWVVFAAVFMGTYLVHLTWQIVLYAVLSLTVIRMLPMLLSLVGTSEPLENRLFMAWFGPRGLASIVFLVIVSDAGLSSESVLIPTVMLTITLCILAHGLTSNAWARRLARRDASPGASGHGG